jgi:hypothetical protein
VVGRRSRDRFARSARREKPDLVADASDPRGRYFVFRLLSGPFDMQTKQGSKGDSMAGAGALVAAAAVAVAGLVGGGCGGWDECSGVHHCPAALYGEVDVPADLPAPIISVTTDAACSTFRADTSPTAPVIVGVKGTIDAGSTLTCQVHAQLADGTEVAASVSFRPLSGCCSSLSTAVGGPTTFAPIQ